MNPRNNMYYVHYSCTYWASEIFYWGKFPIMLLNMVEFSDSTSSAFMIVDILILFSSGQGREAIEVKTNMCVKKFVSKSDLHDFTSPKKGTRVKYNQGSRNRAKESSILEF